MMHSAIITSFFLLLCKAATALDAWSGNISYASFASSDCTGTTLYSGYETSVKAMEYGSFCVTDNYNQGGGDVYGRWVIQCVPKNLTTAETNVPSAACIFAQSCNDVNCQNCSETPIAARQVPWTNFDEGVPQCMVARQINNATSINIEEFATTENFESLLAPPNSESFVGEMGSTQELNEYWQYIFDNSCMGMGVASTTTPSSGYVARGNYKFQFGVLHSLQTYSMLMLLGM